MPGAAATARQADDGAVLREFRRAVAQDLTMLARLHDAEPDEQLLRAVKEVGFPGNLGLNLDSELGREAAAVMQGALGALPDPPDRRILDELAVDYADIYLNHAIRASPYESVWRDEESLERQLPMFEVREHYRRHGLAAPDWRNRADDHLVLQLHFLAHLCSDEETDETLGEAARFMDAHLLRWLTLFARRVADHAGTAYFAGVALVTAAYCEHLRELLARALDLPRPEPEPIRQAVDSRSPPEEAAQTFVPGTEPSW